MAADDPKQPDDGGHTPDDGGDTEVSELDRIRSNRDSILKEKRAQEKELKALKARVSEFESERSERESKVDSDAAKGLEKALKKLSEYEGKIKDYETREIEREAKARTDSFVDAISAASGGANKTILRALLKDSSYEIPEEHDDGDVRAAVKALTKLAPELFSKQGKPHPTPGLNQQAKGKAEFSDDDWQSRIAALAKSRTSPQSG